MPPGKDYPMQNVMAYAWQRYREQKWLGGPFDRRFFAQMLKSAHAIMRDEAAIARGEKQPHYITERERKLISIGSNSRYDIHARN